MTEDEPNGTDVPPADRIAQAVDYLDDEEVRKLLRSHDPLFSVHAEWRGPWTTLAEALEELPDADARWQTVFQVLDERDLIEDEHRLRLIQLADKATNAVDNLYWLARDEEQGDPDECAEKMHRSLDRAAELLDEFEAMIPETT